MSDKDKQNALKSSEKTRIFPNFTDNMRQELRISLTNSDEDLSSTSDSAVPPKTPGTPSVEYNLYLNNQNNKLLSLEPQTPSVADVIFSKLVILLNKNKIN